MGTRSLTVLLDSDETEIVVMYKQFDGYPEGYGIELAEFLSGMKIVNGIGIGDRDGKTANGGSCLAAQVIAHFKEEIGGIYLYPSSTRDVGEEYIYTVLQELGEEPAIEIYDCYANRVLTSGSATEVLNKIPSIEYNSK